MIINRDRPFEWLDITLDYEEAQAILARLRGEPGTYDQFKIMQRFRAALAGFIIEIERERQKGE